MLLHMFLGENYLSTQVRNRNGYHDVILWNTYAVKRKKKKKIVYKPNLWIFTLKTQFPFNVYINKIYNSLRRGFHKMKHYKGVFTYSFGQRDVRIISQNN